MGFVNSGMQQLVSVIMFVENLYIIRGSTVSLLWKLSKQFTNTISQINCVRSNCIQ